MQTSKNNDNTAPRFYGRRRGKALHKARQDALDSVLPVVRLGPDAALHTPASLFPFATTGLWLEIGFGTGEHLLHQALHNPAVGMIGCEPFVNGVAALCKGIAEHDLRNIRIWPDDARLLTGALPDGCIDRLFLLNADPWPKTKHHKRRYVQQDTLETFYRLIRTGGRLHMSTDHPALAAWEVEQTLRHGGFGFLAESPEDWRQRPADMPETRYQKKGMAGHPTVFLNFERLPDKKT